MELRHLRYFVAIAEEGSFTRAAERLWVAQPGLSSQIRRFEGELGVQLFERRARGVELTEAGRLFLGRARAALAAAAAAVQTGRDLETGAVGSVRLGVATGPRWRATSSLLRRFTRERPGVEVTVIEAYGGTLWRDLRDGRLDAMIAPVGHGSADFGALPIGTEPWVVLIGTGHPLAGIGPLAAEGLNAERIGVTGHRDGRALDRTIAKLFEDLGVAPELVPGPPEPAVNDAVADNEVVALTTAPDALPHGVIARRLDPVRVLPFELLWRDEMASPALTEFIRTADNAGRPESTRPRAAVA